MTIIADRGLFIRILTASGKVDVSEAEAYADALDGASKDPATKADIAQLRAEIALLAQWIESQGKRLDDRLDALGTRLIERMDARIEATGEKQVLRFLAISVAVAGALFAALRYTAP